MAELRPDAPNTSELSDFRPDWGRKETQGGSVEPMYPWNNQVGAGDWALGLESGRLEWSHRLYARKPATRQRVSDGRIFAKQIAITSREPYLRNSTDQVASDVEPSLRCTQSKQPMSGSASGSPMKEAGTRSCQPTPVDACTCGMVDLGIEVYALSLPPSFAKPVARE